MHSLRRHSSSSCLLPVCLLFTFLLPIAVHGGGGVLSVKRKFAGSENPPIEHLRNHDAHRHARLRITAKPVDVPLGGSLVTHGLYYTEVAIGTPPKNFTLHVDTGSDVLWVNCVPCEGCTNSSSVLEKMTLYDPKGSSSASNVFCNGSLCKTILNVQFMGKPYDLEQLCPSHDGRQRLCPLGLQYGDGHEVYGLYTTDIVTYNEVYGDYKTQPVSANITIGCAAAQKVRQDVKALVIADGIDGIIGFSQTSNSMISQLAASGKTRKVFAHCLNAKKGGGLFVIGHMMKPKVKMTPLVPNLPYHYHVNMKSVHVGDEVLQLPAGLFETDNSPHKGTIVDSGTTFTYLPDALFKPLVKKIFSNFPNLEFDKSDGKMIKLKYDKRMKKMFPNVTFHFENSVVLEVTPDYYFARDGDWMYFGFKNSGENLGNLTVLGDLVLSDKLVVYDLENQGVGWVNYDCSSSVEVEDDTTGEIYNVKAHDIPASNQFCPSPGASPGAS